MNKILLSILLAASSLFAAPKPNIVLIMADDLVINPAYKKRVEKMKKEYLEIRTGGIRTAPYNFQ
ncbi:hypothetical protein EGM51_04125 [Verrucomicrobia bacterium S94]|nr:hypothetical protein EGM51_04125 [Verrucomicrobia bacterium S94]